jgi:ubiquinone/menaquinone biosynthesis C-methylase UbiE
MLSEKTIDSLMEDAHKLWPSKWNEIEFMFNKCTFSISYKVIMKELKLFETINDFYTLDSIKKKVSIFKDAEYVLEKMLDILIEEEVLKKINGGYELIKQRVDIESPEELLVSAVRKLPDEGAPFQWLSRASGGIVDFIKSNSYGEEIMFPYNDFSLVEDVYYASDVYGFWSKLAGKAVKQLIDNNFNKKITVLEIGAGTGNGTYNVFQNIDGLENKIEKYIFTDISKSLIKKAAKSDSFSKYQFIDYKTFDLTKDIKEQNFEENCADIVLAVNVIHATPDIKKSVQSLYKMVRKGGFAVLGEISPPENGLYRYMELTFGLLASYYNYQDKNIRPLCPIVRPEKWVEIFKNSGFSNAIAIPGNKIENCDRGGVIIAQK